MNEFDRAKAGYKLVAFVVIALVINASIVTGGCVLGELIHLVGPGRCSGETILEAFSNALSAALGYAAGTASMPNNPSAGYKVP